MIDDQYTVTCPGCKGTGVQRNKDGVLDRCPICHMIGKVHKKYENKNKKLIWGSQ